MNKIWHATILVWIIGPMYTAIMQRNPCACIGLSTLQISQYTSQIASFYFSTIPHDTFPHFIVRLINLATEKLHWQTGLYANELETTGLGLCYHGNLKICCISSPGNQLFLCGFTNKYKVDLVACRIQTITWHLKFKQSI